MGTNKISIIVPIFNERRNVNDLTHRIGKIMQENLLDYELIYIDDHSTDDSVEYLNSISHEFPIHTYLKEGKKGKAYSLLEGFKKASGNIIVMIDGDLQYPPESIPQMVNKLNEGFDIVVANRQQQETSYARQVSSKTFNFMFGRILHGLDCDVQSGLKLFKKEIVDRINISPSPWTFDLEFLLKARDAGYNIGSIKIVFSKRIYGVSKINILKASVEIGINAIVMKYKKPEIIPFHPSQVEKKGNGFHYKGKEFIHQTTLPLSESAFHRLTDWQLISFIIIFLLLITFLIKNFIGTLVVLFSTVTLLYLVDILFNLYLVYKGFYHSPEIVIDKNEIDKFEGDWPRYTVLCPLYKEAAVLSQFVNSISKLDYPKDKLEVILLLEENDNDTIRVAQSCHLPDYIQVAVVPNSSPKTKPKACNYGLQKATGKYLVVYDAEDAPEVDQLKKAVIAFSKEHNDVACIQAKLNYYNSSQNLLTRLFTLEYSFWFDLVLPGLHSLNAPIPLGGTSNHFRTDYLKSIYGWDSFNVTEDADLGLRLFKKGFRTIILDSTTFEEANSQFKNWYRQRSRWIKGYMQTYLVHLRHPQDMFKVKKLSLINLIVGMKVLSLIINPILWLMTISFFLLRPIVGPFIESLFPPVIFYIGITCLFVGNFLYIYYYTLGVAKRGLWNLVIIALIVPFYWLMMSSAALMSVWEMLVKPHHWQKTNHGLFIPLGSLNLAKAV